MRIHISKTDDGFTQYWDGAKAKPEPLPDYSFWIPAGSIESGTRSELIFGGFGYLKLPENVLDSVANSHCKTFDVVLKITKVAQ